MSMHHLSTNEREVIRLALLELLSGDAEWLEWSRDSCDQDPDPQRTQAIIERAAVISELLRRL